MQLRLASGARKGLSGLALAALLTFACQRRAPAEAVDFAMEALPSPPRTGLTRVAFQLTGGRKQPVTGAIVEVEGDMSHPGMAPVFGKAREESPGRYSSQLDLNMAGDWVILFHITLPGGQRIERQAHLPGVRN